MKFKSLKVYSSLLLILLASIGIIFWRGYSVFSFVNYISFFLLGTVLAFQDLFGHNIKTKSIFSDFIIFLSLLAIFNIPNFGDPDLTPTEYLFSYIPSSIFIYLIVSHVKNSHGIFNKIFSSYFFRFWGAISYSVYLLHFMIIYLLIELGSKSYILNTTLYFVLIIIISLFSYGLVEYPLSFIRLKRSRSKLPIRVRGRRS